MDASGARAGTVVAAEPGRIVVRIKRDDDECGGCRSCAVRALCRGRDSGHMDLPLVLRGERRYAVGDGVRVVYSPAGAAAAAGALFLPMLAGLGLGGGLAHFLRPGSEWAVVAGCFSGLAAGLAATLLLNRFCPFLKPGIELVE